MSTATRERTGLSYQDRIKLLRQKKIDQTLAKRTQNGPMDEDDYGTVLPPAGFSWRPIPNHENGSFYGLEGWASNFRDLMERHPVYVDPLDALAGRWMVFMSRERPVKWNPRFAYSHLKPFHERYDITPGIGSDSHFAPDYLIGLKLGWGGLLERIDRYRAENGPETKRFYDAEETTVRAVQTWIKRTTDAIAKAETTEARPELLGNLVAMRRVNEKILSEPPETLREVCQWLAWYNMASRIYNRDGAGGQLDELLRPYYESDMAAGRIDDEEAIFLIACLLLNDAHYYQVGGPDPDGRDVTSPISFLILEAGHRMGISANLTIRVHDGLDSDLFKTGVRHLFEDRLGWPRFSGDKALVAGFTKNGYSADLARQRIAVGCNWMALPGREYTLNDCVKINIAKVFEVALEEMLESEGPSVGRLWDLFGKHLQIAVDKTAEGMNFHVAHQKENTPELMLNLLCHGPLEKGRDATDGALEFYNLGIDGCGLATTADSFAALQRRVEEEGALGWDELAGHLEKDFAGVEGERVRLMLAGVDRFGRPDSAGESWAIAITRRFSAMVKSIPTNPAQTFIPGWFTHSKTITMGKKVGATPNGRHSGAPISHGANPDPGFARDAAPTLMARAIAKVQPGYGNTAPIQMEIDPGVVGSADGIEKVAALIKTHFDLGGTLFNINVIDADMIREAHRDPGKYPDLVVRVTGFTAYFSALSPEFRQLVVDRIVEGV